MECYPINSRFCVYDLVVSTTITFLIPPESLSLWTEDHRRIVEPGVFRVMIGNGSEDLRRNKQGEVIDSRQRGLWLTAEFELQ
ncbi:MAG: Fibronectin type III-like domain [Verrucomicrobiota bacterium]